MIISHQHRFIFIKTRKTAGTSIEISLSSICGKDDIISPITVKDETVRKELGFRTAQNYFIPFSKYTHADLRKLLLKRKRAIFRNHMGAEEIKNYIGEDIWDSYFKFTLERNPFDKMVSLYYWRGGDKKFKTIKAFIKSGAFDIIKGFDLYSINKILVVDKVYQFEKLEEALKDISERLGLSEPLKLPDYKAKSGHRKVKDYKDIIDEEVKKQIETAFAREIHLLGYQF